MRESMETFVRGPGNAEAVRALESLSGLRPIPSKLYIEGPRHAGKSTLVRSWAADAERGSAGEAVFACSGADIAMALQFEADDSFFEKLGAAPILLIDDIGLLLQAERGDQLLALMLAERDRLGLSTVVTSRQPASACEANEAREVLASFEDVHLEPLDHAGKRAFVRLAAAEYGTDASPLLEEAAVACIVEMMGARFEDLESATRYLMTDDGCAAHETLDAAAVQGLLQP